MRTVVRQCMGVSPGEEVLVVCNPVTEEIGALMRIEAQGDGADATLAVMSERESAAAEPPRRGRRGDGRGRRGPGADDPVALPHRRPQAASEAGVRVGSLPGVTEEMLTRLMTGDLDEVRRRGWALVAALNGGSRGADHLPPRQRPAARARGPARDRRRRRTQQPRRLRQPALRRGLHRAGRGDGGGHAGRRRLDRRSRPARHADLADGPRRPPDRGHRLRRRRADGAADRPRRRTAPTSPSSGSAPTKRRS